MMHEKKKHWWTKLKEKWQELSPAEQACVISATTGAVTSIAIGASVTHSVDRKIHTREMDELEQTACNEAIRAYDQGVIDGATNPMLLRSLKDLGRI